ncbi:MAG: hypothetical protein GY860_10120, partial [Desulfobacteraceae bacterium]|nr:hypothetical protein [Desulfobacteraceae bacterium]
RKEEQRVIETLITDCVLPLDNKIAGHREQISAMEKQQKGISHRLGKILKETDAGRARQKQAQIRLEKSIAYIARNKHHEGLGETLPVLGTLFDQRTGLTKKLEAIGLKFCENRDQTLDAERQLDGLFKTAGQQQKQITKMDDQLVQLNLEMVEILGGETESAWQKRLAKMVDAIPLRQEIRGISRLFEAGKLNKAELETQFKQFSTFLEQTGKRVNELGLASQTLREQVSDIEIILAQEERIASLSHHRERLAKGDACPLCGAKEHPAIDSYKRLDISENRARKSDKEKELAKLTKDLQGADRDMAGTEARLATCDHQRQALETTFLTY